MRIVIYIIKALKNKEKLNFKNLIAYVMIKFNYMLKIGLFFHYI